MGDGWDLTTHPGQTPGGTSSCGTHFVGIKNKPPHLHLLKKNVLPGLPGAISWVNAGIHRVSFLVALMGFKIFNS